jgi:dihydrodipicolinate synthase/N-acetylneuraminate lyase
MDAPLTGVVPVVPTIFRDDETVDLDGTARVVDYLIDSGVDGLCLLAKQGTLRRRIRRPTPPRSPAGMSLTR